MPVAYQPRRRKPFRQPPGASSSSYSAVPKRPASRRSRISSPVRPIATSTRSCSSIAALPGLVRAQQAQDPLRGDPPAADPLHARLALLLLLQQLALARDVPAVALGDDVLAHRPDRLAGGA